jgi:hypothetical protein
MTRTIPDPDPRETSIECEESRCYRKAAYAVKWSSDYRAICKVHGGGIKRRSWRYDDDLMELTDEMLATITARIEETNLRERRLSAQRRLENDKRYAESKARQWQEYAQRPAYTTVLILDADYSDPDAIRRIRFAIVDPENRREEHPDWNAQAIVEIDLRDGEMPSAARIYNANSLTPEAALELSYALCYAAELVEALNG